MTDGEMKELIRESVSTLEWMIADNKWRADQIRGNLEEGSQGGYSPELTKAMNVLEKWKEL